MYWLSIYLEVLYVDVWRADDLGIPFCWFRSLGALRSHPPRLSGLQHAFYWPDLSGLLVTLSLSSWDSELSELVDKDTYQGGEVYIFPPSYSLKVNRWLPQFSTYSEWQYHGMAQSMNIKMSISEQAGLEKTWTQLAGCRFGWLIAGYLMLFGQLHHFSGPATCPWSWMATRTYPRRGVLLPWVLKELRVGCRGM